MEVLSFLKMADGDGRGSAPFGTNLRIMRSLIIFAVIWFSFAAMAFWWIDFNIYRVTESGDKILKDEWTVESRIAFSCGLGLLVAIADMLLIWIANVILDVMRKTKRNVENEDSE